MMSSSPAIVPASPSSTTPSSPAIRTSEAASFQTSTPNNVTKKQHQPPLSVTLPSTAPSTPPAFGEPTLTPPPRSPGCGDGRSHPHDGTSSDKSSETAVAGVSRTPSAALSRKESYKAQRQHYRREKKRAASALLHNIEDPSVVVLADWLKVRGSLKSWTKLWCVLKPGLLLLYKSPKAKSSHWVGTVLLTSCQVIERPSKKDGFCFKLYHPLEQSIWAPRGPHNETIGAVVQPLPTAHLIFRAPSQAAGHCWLDGLELALRCSNAMLRCSRTKPEQTVAPDAPATESNISHEELERHFNEQADYDSYSSDDKTLPRASSEKPKKSSKWAHFIEALETLGKDDNGASTDSQSPESDKRDGGALDSSRKKERVFVRNNSCTSSAKYAIDDLRGAKSDNKTRSLAASLVVKRSHILGCFDVQKIEKKNLKEKSLSPMNILEENLVRFISTFPGRRSSTPTQLKYIVAQKGISEPRETGVRTDSENDDGSSKPSSIFKRRKISKESTEVICRTPENILITKTLPSVERFSKYSSSSTDEVLDALHRRQPPRPNTTLGKYCLIDYHRLPAASFENVKSERREERFSSQNVYVAGKIVRSGEQDGKRADGSLGVRRLPPPMDTRNSRRVSELAGAASDTDSEIEATMPEVMMEDPTQRKQNILARIESVYVEDQDRETGAAGELVEEVAEENKSLLWFLLKQVRPGMDLSKVVLPTFILEPRSFLDKLADNYYHADLLGQAQSQEDPYLRFKGVLRWYLSGLYRKPKGLKKPYNPVLGETFRCCWKHGDNESFTYYIAEQVSHHPPVSAFYVTNRKEGYVIEGSLLAKSKFYGNSTSAILEGCARVHLLNWGETYITTAPYAHCKGIVIGTLSMELGGKVQILCTETGYQADIEFKLRSFLGGSDQTNAISGRIKKGKETVATVDGYWDGRIDIKDKRTGEETNLVDVAVLKEHRLPRYLVKLEHQVEHESQKLWLKVSEAIYNDDQTAATEQKTIIEEAQRARARNLVAGWVPRHFRKESLPQRPVEGIADQGWIYLHQNNSPWRPEEVIEYEEDYVIRSLGGAASAPGAVVRRSTVVGGARDVCAAAHRLTDSDSHDGEDLARRSKSSTTRTLKQSLCAIDATLREQNLAIERLTRRVESISEEQRQTAAAMRTQSVGRLPTTTHSWDLFGGFVLAIVLQALLNWIFYQKD